MKVKHGTEAFPGLGWATDHPQVAVSHELWDGDAIDVDQEIVPLLRAIWDRGIVTYTCCEDHAGRVLLGFDSATDAEKFVRALGLDGPSGLYAQYEDEESLYYRAAGLPGDQDVYFEGEEPPENNLWDWIVWFTPSEQLSPDFTMRIELRFPRPDLAEVLHLLGAGED